MEGDAGTAGVVELGKLAAVGEAVHHLGGAVVRCRGVVKLPWRGRGLHRCGGRNGVGRGWQGVVGSHGAGWRWSHPFGVAGGVGFCHIYKK